MGYTKLTEQPGPRTEEQYGVNAPGLYPDETAVELDDGTLVAVSVERHWLENGAGIGLHGYARWIKPDGTTVEAPNGAQVESAYTYHADSVSIAVFGIDALATDVARIVLGEEPLITREVPVEGQEPETAFVVNLPDEAKLNASIRNQVKAVAATKENVINI